MTEPTEDCQRFDDAVAELSLGLLSAPAEDELTAHAAGCDRCRSELDAFSRTADRLVDLAPEMTPPDGFAVRALRTFPAEPTAEAPTIIAPHLHTHPRRRRRAVLLTAAAVVLLIAVTAVLWRAAPADDGLRSVATATLVDATGGRHGSVVVARTGAEAASTELTLTLTDVPASTYHCSVVDADGHSIDVASWPVKRRGTDVWTMDLDGSTASPAAVTITDATGKTVASATLG